MKTAVQWFALEIKKVYNISLFEHPDIYEQAKEMEKQQIIEFTNDFIEKHTFGDYDGIVQKNKTVDEYYNETFKNK